MWNLAAVAGGAAAVLVVLTDVFVSVIVPRAERSAVRVSRLLALGLWALWPRIAYRMYPRDDRAREGLLSVFAPSFLVTLLLVWLVILVLGWGLVFYGLHDELRPAGLTFGDCVYFAGASFLTIGYGDITPVFAGARMLSIVCAASGLGVVAVVISFLFAIFGAFQRRETFVVTIGARAGVPPSGVGLLAVHAYAGLRYDLAGVFREGQHWTADVMESHLAYPILAYFRSSHDYESWVGTLGALLDAASLVVSTLEPQGLSNSQTLGQARVMYELGRHLTYDFAHYFDLEHDESTPGIERSEFQDALERLRAEGYQLVDESAAWAKFSELRSAYASALNAMARWLEIPPVQWVGDRSILSPHASAPS